MADQDEMSQQKPKGKRGRRPTGKEPRVPGKPGRPRQNIDEVLAGVTVPLSEMTPAQRRAADTERQRKKRERDKQKAVEVFEPQPPTVNASTLLRLPALLTRVKAASNEAAQAVGGPNAVAVADTKLVLSRDLLERTRRTVANLRGKGVECDNSALVEMGLDAFLTALEGAFNGGQPFEEVEAPPTRRKPIPEVKPKDEK